VFARPKVLLEVGDDILAKACWIAVEMVVGEIVCVIQAKAVI
jgi:hypothetical protein